MRITKAQFDLKALQHGIDTYRQRRGHLPSEQEGLNALVGVSLLRVSTDPWDYPYLYRLTDAKDGYVVYSIGIDGRDDRGGGDDVTTTSKRYSCDDYGINCPRVLVGYGVVSVAVVSLILAVAFSLAALYRWLRRLVLERV